MNFQTLQNNFPDLNFESLTLSRIPRIRILFSKKNFRGMQKSLDFVLRKLFSNQGQLYLLNQVYGGTGGGKKVYGAFLDELENLGLGNVYKHESLYTYINEWNSIVYNRLLDVDYDLGLKISIIDAWGRTLKYGEKIDCPILRGIIFYFLNIWII